MATATTTPDDREEVVGTTPEAVRVGDLGGDWPQLRSLWPWPAFLTLGWGIGVTMNASEVSIRKPIAEEDLQRKIKHLGGGS